MLLCYGVHSHCFSLAVFFKSTAHLCSSNVTRNSITQEYAPSNGFPAGHLLAVHYTKGLPFNTKSYYNSRFWVRSLITPPLAINENVI
jgi:hypothetical protein